MGRGREARPIEERGTLCEGRGRASGATGYPRENGRVVVGFPFSGECVLYSLVGKESKEGSDDETKGCGSCR
jgi:hypothetical protein